MSVDISAISRVVGVTVDFEIFESGAVTFLPQQVALLGQGNTAETFGIDPVRVTTAQEVADVTGQGSPAHLAALQLFPDNGDGIGSIPVTLYPMIDDGAGVAAAGSIGAVGTQTNQQTYLIKINEIPSLSITIPATTTADAALGLMKTAIDGVLKMPVLGGVVAAGSLPVTAKWKGLTGNDIFIEIEGTEDGITFTVTQPTGGTTVPDVDLSLAKIIDRWETMVITTTPYDDTATLNKYELWGKGRWGELVKKPALVFQASVDDRGTRTAVTDAAARKDDYINALIAAPGSKELPFVIASRGVARVAKKANNLPGNDNYDTLSGLVAGPESSQEDYINRDASLKAGSGTTILVNGDIKINDLITMYHPDGETNPGYRYVANIVKLMNIVFNIRIIFEADDWVGAPLMPAGKVTTRSDAKSPDKALTAMGNLAVNLQKLAIIADADFTKANMTSDINGQNPNRLDNVFPVKLSGNVQIIDNLIKFGFFFPAA
jgi:phage tail sheath gpL-like